MVHILKAGQRKADKIILVEFILVLLLIFCHNLH